MAECTARGNRLSTDSPTACVDEGRDLASCPYSDATGRVGSLLSSVLHAIR